CEVRNFAILEHGHGVGLTKTQAVGARPIEGSDWRNASESTDEAGKQAGLANLRVETKLEGDVLFSILVVVNFHFVENVGIEGEIVRAVGGFKERIDIQNHGDPVRMVKADERVPIGHVGGAVERGNWRLAMAGSKQAAGKQHSQC